MERSDLNPGDIKWIMQHAGVSRPTINKAITTPEKVRIDKLKAINKAFAELQIIRKS